MLHLGPIWYHSEPSDVPYSQNLPRPISWFGLFLQQNDSSMKQQSTTFIVATLLRTTAFTASMYTAVHSLMIFLNKFKKCLKY